MALTYRILPADEYERLIPFNREHSLPDPIAGYNIVGVIEDAGVIVARWDILNQPHLDNGCVAKSHRTKFLNLRKLYKLMEAELPGNGFKIYSTSLLESARRVLRRIGFNEYEAPLYVKQR